MTAAADKVTRRGGYQRCLASMQTLHWIDPAPKNNLNMRWKVDMCANSARLRAKKIRKLVALQLAWRCCYPGLHSAER